MAKSKIHIALIQSPDADIFFDSGWCNLKKGEKNRDRLFQSSDALKLLYKTNASLSEITSISLVDPLTPARKIREYRNTLLCSLNFSGLLCVKGRRVWTYPPSEKTWRANQRPRSETLNHSHRAEGEGRLTCRLSNSMQRQTKFPFTIVCHACV